MGRYDRIMALILLAFSVFASATNAEEGRSILVQSTTSTANSGLYDHLLPIFQNEHDIRVDVVAVGTGQAIKNAKNCDGDVLLVHAKELEEAFVAEGFGLERTDLMYNDFVIVGPAVDPAGISGLVDAKRAFIKIANAGALFASRGDESGTHVKEQSIWQSSGVDPEPYSGEWYRETGSGMGATLNVAVGLGAYALTDRATWISFSNKQDFQVLVEGRPELRNQYGVIPVNSKACPNVDAEAADTFVNWLLSKNGQQTISDFKIDGQQLFFPNAPEN